MRSCVSLYRVDRVWLVRQWSAAPVGQRNVNPSMKFCRLSSERYLAFATQNLEAIARYSSFSLKTFSGHPAADGTPTRSTGFDVIPSAIRGIDVFLGLFRWARKIRRYFFERAL